jgi:hypothetical protein
MLEYSTEIDDSIPCQRSRIFHPKLVEYANILLIPCHLLSALFLTTGQAVDRATLARSSSQASLDFSLDTYYFICHYRQI